jgi:adenylate cyclase
MKIFNMLHDFFADIERSRNWGHIYQYVGDEVVICWKNTPKNKLRCLKFVSQAVLTFKRKEKYYLEQYGVAPTFKAGIHAGCYGGLYRHYKKDLYSAAIHSILPDQE